MVDTIPGNPDSPGRVLSLDCELGEYIQAFASSSRRVLWAIVALAVTSLLIFSGYRNSMKDSWINSRLAQANTALEHQVWRLTSPSTDDEIEFARRWAKHRGFRDGDDVGRWKAELESHLLDHVLHVQVPFLGLGFDVNDLGILGGIALVILMVVLTACTVRQHENLYLGLWRVKDLAGSEECGKGSRANVLYHALAMTEVFNKPPTLARWKSWKLKMVYRLVLLFPLAVQLWIFRYDMQSIEIGLLLNKEQAVIGMSLQVAALLSLLALTCCCSSYWRASDHRWATTFLKINPDLKEKDPPSWMKWVRLADRPRFFWLLVTFAVFVIASIIGIIVHALAAVHG